MSKFDRAYQQILEFLQERHYINSVFEDNVRLLVKALDDQDYLDSSKDIDKTVESVMSQPQNVKTLTLDTQEQSLPPIKLLLSQDSDSESFAVTVVNVTDPSKQKQFKNSMLETIFDDVLEYIKTASLARLAPEAAVDALPAATGGNAQPGAGPSELPAV